MSEPSLSLERFVVFPPPQATGAGGGEHKCRLWFVADRVGLHQTHSIKICLFFPPLCPSSKQAGCGQEAERGHSQKS